MKSEKEFLDGVYEKYEKELEKRRKRTKTLSMYATLSACACVALVIAIRVLPDMNNSAKDATATEAGYVFGSTKARGRGCFRDGKVVQSGSKSAKHC